MGGGGGGGKGGGHILTCVFILLYWGCYKA